MERNISSKSKTGKHGVIIADQERKSAPEQRQREITNQPKGRPIAAELPKPRTSK